MDLITGGRETLLLIAAPAAAILAAAWCYARYVWFYRDPPRTSPSIPGALLAPADGLVVYIKLFQGGKVVSHKLGEPIPLPEIGEASVSRIIGGSHPTRSPGGDDLPQDGYLLGIYMSPLDVHYNYAPADGVVTKVFHVRAPVNLPMVDLWEYVKMTYLRRAVDLFTRKFRLVNERNTIFIKTLNGFADIALVEIADKFVNKIDCFVKEGDTLVAGQKISFIRRGSQVDVVIFSRDVEFLVKTGDHVTGGETVVARMVRTR